MGVVYKARDLRLERLVAIKLLPPHLASLDDSAQRLARERFILPSRREAERWTREPISGRWAWSCLKC
jgi:serine/threonine protein kinase